MKYMVISQPKAGTYLCANLLETLGLKFSGVHIDPGMYRIFYNNNPLDYDKHDVGLDRALSVVPEGQFGVGHIPCTEENKLFLQDTKKILITRGKKGIQDSAKRYKKEKHVGVDHIINDNNLALIKLWQDEDLTFHITFSDIIQENAKKIDNLQTFLFGEVRTNSDRAARVAKKKDSMTKSSIRD